MLEHHIEDRRWFDKVRERLPERSGAAIRKRMFLLRVERGISWRKECGVAAGGGNWQKKVPLASAQLAAAILGRPAQQPTCRLWCQQCDRMVDDVQADACGSAWCKAKDQAA